MAPARFELLCNSLSRVTVLDAMRSTLACIAK
jgi:hypothetical protein